MKEFIELETKIEIKESIQNIIKNRIEKINLFKKLKEDKDINYGVKLILEGLEFRSREESEEKIRDGQDYIKVINHNIGWTIDKLEREYGIVFAEHREELIKIRVDNLNRNRKIE